MSQFPSRNIGPVKAGPLQPQGGAAPSVDWARLLQAAKNATANSINQWAQQAAFIDGRINAVNAFGGKIVSPVVLETEINSAMISAGGPQSICGGVSSGLWMKFKEWYQGYQLGGVPWYPAFAAFPGPFAPPMPNVPSPLGIGASAGLSGLTANNLADGIRQRIGATGMGLNGAGQFVTDYAAWFSQKMTFWLASAMWLNVIGSGPIPSFAPPYVPVGPVAGGTFKGNPGCLSGARFMV